MSAVFKFEFSKQNNSETYGLLYWFTNVLFQLS